MVEMTALVAGKMLERIPNSFGGASDEIRSAIRLDADAGLCHMKGEVLVAEQEPVVSAEPLDILDEIPAFAGASPSALGIAEVSERRERLSISGQIRRPRCSKSSPTLTMIVAAPGEEIRSNPSASFRTSTPPHSATIFFSISGVTNALLLPVRSSKQVLTCRANQRCRAADRHSV